MLMWVKRNVRYPGVLRARCVLKDQQVIENPKGMSTTKIRWMHGMATENLTSIISNLQSRIFLCSWCFHDFGGNRSKSISAEYVFLAEFVRSPFRHRSFLDGKKSRRPPPPQKHSYQLTATKLHLAAIEEAEKSTTRAPEEEAQLPDSRVVGWCKWRWLVEGERSSFVKWRLL